MTASNNNFHEINHCNYDDDDSDSLRTTRITSSSSNVQKIFDAMNDDDNNHSYNAADIHISRDIINKKQIEPPEFIIARLYSICYSKTSLTWTLFIEPFALSYEIGWSNVALTLQTPDIEYYQTLFLSSITDQSFNNDHYVIITEGSIIQNIERVNTEKGLNLIKSYFEPHCLEQAELLKKQKCQQKYPPQSPSSRGKTKRLLSLSGSNTDNNGGSNNNTRYKTTTVNGDYGRHPHIPVIVKDSYEDDIGPYLAGECIRTTTKNGKEDSEKMFEPYPTRTFLFNTDLDQYSVYNTEPVIMTSSSFEIFHDKLNKCSTDMSAILHNDNNNDKKKNNNDEAPLYEKWVYGPFSARQLDDLTLNEKSEIFKRILISFKTTSSSHASSSSSTSSSGFSISPSILHISTPVEKEKQEVIDTVKNGKNDFYDENNELETEDTLSNAKHTPHRNFRVIKNKECYAPPASPILSSSKNEKKNSVDKKKFIKNEIGGYASTAPVASKRENPYITSATERLKKKQQREQRNYDDDDAGGGNGLSFKRYSSCPDLDNDNLYHRDVNERKNTYSIKDNGVYDSYILPHDYRIKTERSHRELKSSNNMSKRYRSEKSDKSDSHSHIIKRSIKQKQQQSNKAIPRKSQSTVSFSEFQKMNNHHTYNNATNVDDDDDNDDMNTDNCNGNNTFKSNYTKISDGIKRISPRFFASIKKDLSSHPK